MKKILFLLLLSFNLEAFAKKLDHIEVLGLKYTEKGFEVKLKDTKLTPDGFFYVVIDSSDPKSLEHTALILSKEKLKLDIKSFSAKPAGSIYKSSQIKIHGELKKGNLLPFTQQP